MGFKKTPTTREQCINVKPVTLLKIVGALLRAVLNYNGNSVTKMKSVPFPPEHHVNLR